MKTIGFIGLGLIGGSIAKAIRKFHLDYNILAYAKHKETLAAALQCGAIDGVLDAEDDRYRLCDYIFLCAPVEYNIEYLKYLKNVISDACIITDAGSVKGPIHQAVEELGMDHCFIRRTSHGRLGAFRFCQFYGSPSGKRILYSYARRRSFAGKAYGIFGADRLSRGDSYGAYRGGA